MGMVEQSRTALLTNLNPGRKHFYGRYVSDYPCEVKGWSLTQVTKRASLLREC